MNKRIIRMLHAVLAALLVLTGLLPVAPARARTYDQTQDSWAAEDKIMPVDPTLRSLEAAQSLVAIDPGDWVQTNPSATADSVGNTYAVWQDEREGAPHVRFAQRSADGDWQASLKLDPTAAGDQKVPQIATDGAGNLYAVWEDYRGAQAQIYFAHRPAGGSWGTSDVISATTEAQIRPSLAVNRRGEVVISWLQGNWGAYNIFCAVRSAGGDWGAAELVTEAAANIGTTDAAIDDWGRVYVAWDDLDQNRILFTERSPEGVWSAEEQVRDSTTGMPWGTQIAVDRAGNAHAVWEDGRSGGLEIYAAYRPSGGTWSVNVRIDDGDGNMWSPGLGIDGAGNVVAAWSEENTDVYGAIHYMGSGWTPSELLVAAPTSTSKSPLGSQAVRSWLPGLALLGPGGTLLVVGASTLGDTNILGQNTESPGSNGCDGDSCRAGNGEQEPPLSGDEGFIGPPEQPSQMSGYTIEPVDVDGQTVYVVRTGSGQVGIYSDEGDAESFGQEHADEPLPGLSFGEGSIPPADQSDETVPDEPEGPTGETGSWWSTFLGSDNSASDSSDESAGGSESWWTSLFGSDGPDVDVPEDPENATGSWWNPVAAEPTSGDEGRDTGDDDQAPIPPTISAEGSREDGPEGDQPDTTFSAQDSDDSEWTITILETGETVHPAVFDRLSIVSVYPGDLGPPPGNQSKQSDSTGKATDPVLPHSGEFVHERTLLHIPGRGLDYALHLTYHSQLIYDGPLGWGWEHSYDRRIVSTGGGSLALKTGDGRFDVYSFDGADFTPPAGRYTALVSETTGITITDRYGGFEGYHPLDGSAAEGRLRSVADRHGNALHFAYDGQGRLQTVTDTLGREISYSYDGSDHIAAVTDFSGRTVTLDYDANGDLVSITTPPVTGTLHGNDFPLGKNTVFSYTSGFDDQRLNHNLTTIVAPNEVADGSLTPRTVNTYGEAGFAFDRVVNQSWGGGRTNGSGVPAGGEVTLAYTTTIAPDAPAGAASKTTITDRGGNVTELWHDGAGHRLRQRRVVDGQNLVTDHTYNADGQVTSITYPAASRVEYTYDEEAAERFAQGNLLEARRVADAERGCDGAGSTPCPDLVTSYTYEPNFQQLRTSTDARDHTITRTHDAEGNLVRVDFPEVTVGLAAPQSASESWSYNEWGQPLIFTDTEGNATCYEYAASGPAMGYRRRVTRDCAPSTGSGQALDLVTEYGYDSVGNLTVITDERGVRTEYTVNALNQVVEKTRAAGTGLDYQTRYWYDANDNLVRRDVENVAPDLDADFHPTGAHSRDGANSWLSTEYVYDLLDNVVQMTAEVTASGWITTAYGYDELERLISLTDAEGKRAEYAYDARGLLTETVGGAGSAEAVTVTFDYDSNANLTRRTDGEGNPTDFVYDGFDRRVGRVDAVGNVALWRYDADGNLVESIFRDGQDGRNPMRSITATAPVTLTHAVNRFDERNRRYARRRAFFSADVDSSTITPITSDGNGDGWVETSYTFNQNGNLTAVGDDNGNFTTLAYDGLDRLTLITDALSNTIAYAYDGNSNLVRTVATERQPDALIADETFTTTYAYDVVNRLVETSDNLGQTSRRAYDSRDNLVFVSDSNGAAMGETNDHGNTALFAYDGLGRLVSETHHLRAGGLGAGAVTGETRLAYAYDGGRNRLGNLTRRTDPNGNVTTYAYDALDRLTLITYADGTSEALAYDRAHNLVERTDANGNVITHTYDALNRPVRTDVARASGVGGTTLQTFAWDGLSRLISASDDNDPGDPADDSALTFSYDSLFNPRGETQDGYTVTRAYDGLGNRLNLAYPGGAVLTYTYDALNRVASVADSSGELASYDYVGPRRLLRRANGNGTYATYTYDGARRLIEVAHRRSSDDALLGGFSYTYDRGQNRTGETVLQSGVTISYTYDSLDRLVGAQGAGGDFEYIYDAAGNRVLVTEDGLPKAYAANQVNEYESVDGETRTHDANGNLLSRQAVIHSLCHALSYVEVTGPATVLDGGAATFTALAGPPTATLPVAYTWRASGQAPQVHTGGGLSDTATFTWDIAGTHAVTVTAANACGDASDSRSVNVGGGDWYVYLPLLMKGLDGTRIEGYISIATGSLLLSEEDVITETLVSYEYDFADRLLGVTTVVTVTDGGDVTVSTATVRYTYDATGRLVGEQVDGESVRYVYARGQVIEERDGDDALIATYVEGLTLERDGTRLFYQIDGLGSTRALVDESGDVVERVEYGPFGDPIFSEGGGESKAGNPYLFRGRRYDADTGLYIYGGRRYDPTTGRYAQRGAETLGNPYAFARNNPVRPR